MTDARNFLQAKSPESRSQIAGLLQADRISSAEIALLGLSLAPGRGSAQHALTGQQAFTGQLHPMGPDLVDPV